jgi:tetratricopeptide (TPR) repeat protein
MKRLLLLWLLSATLHAQVDKIVIPAGTPEDQALQAISAEADAQKKNPMYEDFVQKFSANPMAVAYGNWQLSQSYFSAGDTGKALSYGDKALAASPHNLEILVSQVQIATQMKDNAKVIDYAVKGGDAYNSIGKETRPAEMSEEDFATHVQEEKTNNKASYDYLETSAFNAITSEQNPKDRMAFIERYTPAFPGSRFEEQVSQFAIYSLQQLNDTARLAAYGEKTLAANPNSIPTLILLSSAYVEDPKIGNVNKAMAYARKALELAKPDAADADHSRKLAGGVAHSTLGYALLKQDKTLAAIGELKAGSTLLKDDPAAYSTVLYRLGFAYAKLNRLAEAREALAQAVQIQGPFQQPSRELLEKVNAAHNKPH